MAAPRRTTLATCATCLAILALTEYAVITIAVLPLASTRDDWTVATLVVAPLAALFLVWLGAFIARIVADVLAFVAVVLAFLRYMRQWIAKPASRPDDASATHSPITSSAAHPSSSAGWPSPGRSYTSPRGRKGPPGHEP